MRVLVFAAAIALGGCQYVFGVDFLDDPKLAGKAPAAGAVVAVQSAVPCAPGEPDCTASPDGGADRGLAGASHVVTFASGASHACKILGDGTVKCFGDNASGELGNDDVASSTGGVSVVGLTNVRSLATGSFHTCALLGDGTVKCWGNNDFGQLGDGTLETRLVPAVVPLLTNVVALAAGSEHTCALLGGGGVKCWGANDQGQLGNNSHIASKSPLDVPIVATSIASGVSAQHTCASTATGVMCWGANEHGQLGNGTLEPSLVPRDVAGVGPGQLAAGVGHTCALTADGVFCWGDNQVGQLGRDDLVQSPAPILVTGLGPSSGATQLACGTHHCCTAMASNVECWGDNTGEHVGTDGKSTPVTRAPQFVTPALMGPQIVATGEGSTCAEGAQGVTCWGGGVWDESLEATSGSQQFSIGGL